jgi:Ca2+-binding EF-hand superfamily protein
MKTQSNCLLIILSACFLIAVFALPDSYAVHELFKSIDKNRDGKVTLREFREDMKEHAFERLDEDDDQMIGKEEWKSLNNISDREKHVNLFEQVDKNKDRRINFFEFSNYADEKSNIYEAFMGLDKDGSNNLSPDEITVRPLFKMITIRFW